jgi:bacillithiol biosynthesis cysteine-adding enzyme BshC
MAKATAGVASKAGTTLIPPGNLNYTRLYLDFLSGSSPAADFYPSQKPASVLTALDAAKFDRNHIIDTLTRQNRMFGSSDAAFRQIERLRDPRTVCVFAGQQAGLFSGPLFTLIKALGSIKLAQAYEQRLGRSVIPIFWIAGDDHDFVEINHAHVLSRTGEVCKLEYKTAPPRPLPAAEIRLDDRAELERVLVELGEYLGHTDLTAELFDLLKRTYTSDDTFVSSFGKFVAALTAEFGLVLFNPADAEVKRQAVPLFETILNNHESIRGTLVSTNKRLRQAGYHLQVEKKDESVHLFCNLDGRQPIMCDGDVFVIGSRRFSRTELLGLLEEAPEKFSTDVMTRPLLQAWLFPVLGQMGGPSEIAYFAQLNGLFPLVDRPAPVYHARPSVTLLERRIEQTMQEFRICYDEVRGDIEQVINRVLGETFPVDLQKDFAEMRKAVAFEPGLKETSEQVRGKIDFQLTGFEAKIFSAHKKKSQQTRERIYRVVNSLYPNRTPQERCLNSCGFLARHGFGFVRFLYEHMDAEQTAHQLISLREFEA